MTGFSDRNGKTPEDRVREVRRPYIGLGDFDQAVGLLTAMLEAADRWGATLDDFDGVTDLPAVCLDVIRRKQ